jgi:hypothetical protein
MRLAAHVRFLGGRGAAIRPGYPTVPPAVCAVGSDATPWRVRALAAINVFVAVRPSWSNGYDRDK